MPLLKDDKSMVSKHWNRSDGLASSQSCLESDQKLVGLDGCPIGKKKKNKNKKWPWIEGRTPSCLGSNYPRIVSQNDWFDAKLCQDVQKSKKRTYWLLTCTHIHNMQVWNTTFYLKYSFQPQNAQFFVLRIGVLIHLQSTVVGIFSLKSFIIILNHQIPFSPMKFWVFCADLL